MKLYHIIFDDGNDYYTFAESIEDLIKSIDGSIGYTIVEV